jgi:hypothetical protein
MENEQSLEIVIRKTFLMHEAEEWRTKLARIEDIEE